MHRFLVFLWFDIFDGWLSNGGASLSAYYRLVERCFFRSIRVSTISIANIVTLYRFFDLLVRVPTWFTSEMGPIHTMGERLLQRDRVGLQARLVLRNLRRVAKRAVFLRHVNARTPIGTPFNVLPTTLQVHRRVVDSGRPRVRRRVLILLSSNRHFFNAYARVNNGVQLAHFLYVVDGLRMDARIDFVTDRLFIGR